MEPPGVTFSTNRSLERVSAPRVRRGSVGALLAVAAIVAAACTPAASPSTRPSTAGGPASQAPTSEPSAPAAPALFRIVGDTPVIERTVVPDRGAILPGAVAVDDGTYHAWVVAFGDPPGTQDVHHLTSADAVSWTVAEDGSLLTLSEGLGNPGAVPASVLDAGDEWVMYYTGTLASERQGWDVRRATAPGPDGPWTPDAEPVLRRGPAGAWDSGGLDFPSVVPTEDGFAMLYSGVNPQDPNFGAIGLATSEDGIAWTKHDDPTTTDGGHGESDPVAEPGLCGEFDARALQQPRLIQFPDRLVMAYGGYSSDIESGPSVGYADSLNGGETWACEWPSPALDPTGLPEGGLHTLAAFQRDGRLALLVEWLSNDGSDVWLAELGFREE
jgi:hypothetical protein